MTPQDVMTVLRELGVKQSADPYGFTLPDGWRLVRGSGVAGRGHFWGLTKYRGEWAGPHGSMVANRRALRRLLIEWMAGPRPVERDGYMLLAKVVNNRFGESFVWYYRRRKATP